MTTPVVATDPNDDTRQGVISKYGQQVIGALDFSIPVARSIDAPDPAVFNFIVPKQSLDTVITGIILVADRAAPVGGSEVSIYEASAIDSLVVDTLILADDLPRQGRFGLTGLNMFVPAGKWVNIKSDITSGAVRATILYYRAPRITQ